MPASASRYQSRLFNFIAEQSQKFADGTSHTLRTIKVATLWGVQAILYPIYALVQTTRSLSTGLGNSVSSDDRQLPHTNPTVSAEVDTPLQTVLEEVVGAAAIAPPKEDLSPWGWLNRLKAQLFFFKQPEVKSDSLQPSLTLEKTSEDLDLQLLKAKIQTLKVKIQGLASQRSDRSLVLIGDRNQVLEILTPQQERKIQQRIVEQLANIGDEMPPSFPPLRQFHQLMTWVQTSPLARSLNLFQEANAMELSHSSIPVSNDRPSSPNLWTQTATLFPISSPSQLTDLDSTVADLENRHVEGVTQFKEDTEAKIKALIRAAIDYFFGQSHRPLSQSESKTLEGNSNPSLPRQQSPSLPQNSPLTFPTLDNPENRETTAPEALPKTSPLEDSSISQICQFVNTSLSNLSNFWPSQPPTQPTPNPDGTESKALLPKLPLHGPFQTLQKTLVNRYKSLLQDFGLVSETSTSKKVEETELATVSTEDLTLFPSQSPQAIANSFSDAKPTPNPSKPSAWVETQATSVEYVKHPLERILEALDRIIFWIEERVAGIWQWIQQYWR